MSSGWRAGRILLLALLAAAASPAGVPDRAFEQVKTLVGDWQTELAGGRRLHVSYRLVSADTALLETFGTTRPTLTVFHLDGDRLLATHYCAQGNQPRLRLSASTATHLVFEFLDATNLGKGAPHLRRLELDLVDADHFKRAETYRSNKGSETTTYSFERVGTVPAGH